VPASFRSLSPSMSVEPHWVGVLSSGTHAPHPKKRQFVRDGEVPVAIVRGHDNNAASISWSPPGGATGSRQSMSRTGRCVRVSSEVSRCSERPRFSSASTFTRSRGCADYGFWRAFRLPAKSEPALSPKPRPFWRHRWRPVSRSVPALQRPCRLKLLTPSLPSPPCLHHNGNLP
jgi:hypothetical protein